MFIHWGFYALTELQEQAFVRYDMNRARYEALMHQFNPMQYQPEEWVLLAKQAGMRYICFTAKHHDGFCMWDTRYTDYSIMHTPYGKDVLRQLADACHKHGMLLSLYYSCPDWHHPCAYNPASTHQWRALPTQEDRFTQYKRYLLNQITELLTNYGPIYTLFWDIPPRLEDRSVNEYVRSLQPGIYINNRGFDDDDFSTPEREYSADDNLARFPHMTEACNSIDAQSWGYRREADFYSLRHLLSSIDKTMARGGSYLLNIGPRADGTLDPQHAQRIRLVGDWYGRMRGCLEEHEPDDFDYGVHKSGECIINRKGNRTYFHFFNGTRSSAVALARFPHMPRRVMLLNTGADLPFCKEVLPDYFNGQTGVAEHEYLHIRGIPTEELGVEPVVIEIEW